MQIDKFDFLANMKVILNENILANPYEDNTNNFRILMNLNPKITKIEMFMNEPILVIISGELNKIQAYKNIVEFFKDGDSVSDYYLKQFKDNFKRSIEGGYGYKISNINLNSTYVMEYLIPIMDDIINTTHNNS